MTEFFMVMSNMCGSLVWKLLHATIMAARILRWLTDFCKIYATLFQRLSLTWSPSSGKRKESSRSCCSHEIELIGIGFLLHFYLRMMTASLTHYVVFTHTVDKVNCCCCMPLLNYRMVPKLNVHPLTGNSLRWQEILIWANERYEMYK